MQPFMESRTLRALLSAEETRAISLRKERDHPMTLLEDDSSLVGIHDGRKVAVRMYVIYTG